MVWSAIRQLFRPAALRPSVRADAISLLAFADGEQGLRRVAKWKVLTDKAIGGSSEAEFEITEPQRQKKEGQQQEGLKGIFSGTLCTDSANPKITTGYCAVKVEFDTPIRVTNLPNFELRVRTDGRTYLTNLQVKSFFPDELYQGFIKVPANKWLTIQLPFHQMTLTRLGKVADVQRDLDGTFEIESIGFLLADGQNGPFRLEVESVRAVA